ncbi:MAG TPA: DUF2267 domain-containing protein [Micromonosporaceae bacterium]
MKYESFLGEVAQRASISPGQAENAVRATMETLAERLTSGEVLDLAAQLPEPMSPMLHPSHEEAEKFGAQEFVRRVATRFGSDERHARAVVRAVFATMREAVSSGEFDDVLAQLPRDFCAFVNLADSRVNLDYR